MPKRSDPWSYKKRKRSKKSKKNTDSEDIEDANMETESSNSLSENQLKTNEVVNPPIIKQEPQLTVSPVKQPIKRTSTALIASFGLLDAQKPTEELPTEIKKEPLDDSRVDDGDVEIIGAYKPVKKFKVLEPEPNFNLNEDIVIVTECTIEKEGEDFLGTSKDVADSDNKMEIENASLPRIENEVKKEEMCDTAPSSPVPGGHGEVPYQFTPEELELTKLSLTESSSSPLRQNESQGEIISADNVDAFERHFNGFETLKFLDFDSKTKLIDLYNTSVVLTGLKSNIDSIKQNLLKYSSPSSNAAILNLVANNQPPQVNTPVIPPPLFSRINEVHPQSKTVPECCLVNSSISFKRRELAADVFRKELDDISSANVRLPLPAVESRQVTMGSHQHGSKSENNVDHILKFLGSRLIQSTSSDNGDSLSVRRNNINEIGRNVQSEASNAYNQHRLLSERLQSSVFATDNLPPLPRNTPPLPLNTPPLPLNTPPLPLNTPPLPPNTPPLPLDTPPLPLNTPPLPLDTPPFKANTLPLTANHSALPNSRNFHNQISMDIDEQTMHSYRIGSNVSADSRLTASNAIISLPKHSATTIHETMSLNDNMLKKQSFPHYDNSETSMSPTNQTDNSEIFASSDPRKSRNSLEIPNKVPRYEAAEKIMQFPSNKKQNVAQLFSAAMADIRTEQSRLNKGPAPQSRIEVGKHFETDGKKKIDIKDYMKRKPNVSDRDPRLKSQPGVLNNGSSREQWRQSEIDHQCVRNMSISHMPSTGKDLPVGRAIEVVNRRFSSENDPKSSNSAQHNMSFNSDYSLQNISSTMNTPCNEPFMTGNVIPVLNRRGNLEYPQQRLTNQFLQQIPTNQFLQQMHTNQFSQKMPTNQFSQQMPTNQFSQQMPTNQFSQQMPTNQFLQQMPTNQSSQQMATNQFSQQMATNQFSQQAPTSQFLQQLPLSYPLQSINRPALLPSPFVSNVRDVRIPLLSTPQSSDSMQSPLLATDTFTNSPTPMETNMHQHSPHLLSDQSSHNLTMHQTPSNLVPAPVSLEKNANDQRKTAALPRRTPKNISLVPRSVKEDLGRTYVPSSYVYLIIIEWNYDWLAQFETSGEPYHSPPPILPPSTYLSQVRNTYSDEQDYYNTYFKLLLAESWFKLYVAWKEMKRERRNQIIIGKISHYESKNEFNKYVIECFVHSSNEALPKESGIVLLTFKTRESTYITMLGYVTKIVNRQFDGKYDDFHEAYKVLKISKEKEIIYKYKITIYTVFKSDDIDDNELVTIQKLINVRKILQQNDALINVCKSPLFQVVLSPITSPHKFSASIPNGGKEFSSVMDQVCNRVFDPNPLLALIHAEWANSEARMIAISYLINKLHSVQPDSKVIICSKSEDTLSCIASDLKRHNPVYINKDRIGNLQKYSLTRLIEKNMPKPKNDKVLSEEEMNMKKKARNQVLQKSDVILMLLLGFESDEYSVASLIKEFNVACCILDEANTITEPESIIPLTYGIKKYVLIGNKKVLCEVSPFTHTYDYNRSLFNRASL